jgi:hypothetical protein
MYPSVSPHRRRCLTPRRAARARERGRSGPEGTFVPNATTGPRSRSGRRHRWRADWSVAIAVRSMIAHRATAAATSIAVHSDSARRGASRRPTSAIAYPFRWPSRRDGLLRPSVEQPRRHTHLHRVRAEREHLRRRPFLYRADFDALPVRQPGPRVEPSPRVTDVVAEFGQVGDLDGFSPGPMVGCSPGSVTEFSAVAGNAARPLSGLSDRVRRGQFTRVQRDNFGRDPLGRWLVYCRVQRVRS